LNVLGGGGGKEELCREIHLKSRIQVKMYVLKRTSNISTTGLEKNAKKICKNMRYI
jgi:hypothetical protein